MLQNLAFNNCLILVEFLAEIFKYVLLNSYFYRNKIRILHFHSRIIEGGGVWHKRLKNQPVRDDDDIEVRRSEIHFCS